MTQDNNKITQQPDVFLTGEKGNKSWYSYIETITRLEESVNNLKTISATKSDIKESELRTQEAITKSAKETDRKITEAVEKIDKKNKEASEKRLSHYKWIVGIILSLCTIAAILYKKV
uniref:Uncharacterized protein n=1 Tax=Candidatus Kentrum sp. FW TaxID=2126338 RepID=A0A450SY89_9GAMM|nr:MAG: hypothetical protein BECKFW1821A_GA0114235_104011 [Candidatus Kentron sp. FW]VFJ59171.1 MAG: hypothetical protein BECKFW1821B_GA0114236_104611 [Candidatus Kentron sp. FW]